MPLFLYTFMFEFICGPLQNSSHTITVQKSSTCLNDRPNSENGMFYYSRVPNKTDGYFILFRKVCPSTLFLSPNNQKVNPKYISFFHLTNFKKVSTFIFIRNSHCIWNLSLLISKQNAI